MTIGLQIKQPQELVMAVGAAVQDLDELLRLLARHYYDKVIIYGGEADQVSEPVWAVVKKAEHHGITVEDATPPGSEFSRGFSLLVAP
ncbi:MAG TPA: hypothetical protein VGE31_01625 [Candidatus Paceibacterota bacterium]